MELKFDIPNLEPKIIKVIGVGGGGSNAVNHMYNLGIKDVDFLVCNTDKQALLTSPVPNKVHIGTHLTAGLGAGANAEVGKKAALESLEEIKHLLSQNTKMLFVTAGMGGGTGTGAAPIIAGLAKNMGILTVGIVTTPFSFEGKRRREQAEQGIEELRQNVDALIIIKNDQLRHLFGNLSVKEAFSKADDTLSIAARGIAEIITVKGYVNVDFMDVYTVMKDSGVALMGTGMAQGANRAVQAVQAALDCPLLHDNDIYGAENALLHIAYGTLPLSMDENGEITDYLAQAIGLEAENLIWGISEDADLGDNIRVTLVATGFQKNAGEFQQPEFKHILDTNLDKPKSSEELIIKQPSIPDLFAGSQFSFEPLREREETAMPKSIKPEFNPQKEVLALDDTQKEQGKYLFNFEELEALKQQQKIDHQDPRERLNRLQKNVLDRMKSPSGINDLEREPAYMRRNVKLADTPHSQEGLSRFSVAKKGNKLGLKTDNAFLHDNVD
jgi:cell division protein FtsZ